MLATGEYYSMLMSINSATYTKLRPTCEAYHLAFHTCLFPRLPVLQFGAAFSSLAFSVPEIGNVSLLT